jgi:hypothetical protein
MIVQRSIVLAVCTAVVTLAAAPAAGQGGKPKPGTLFPVTAEFRCPSVVDCGSTGPDRLTGDGDVYTGTTPAGSTTTQDGTAENLGAYFTLIGDFLFVLKSWSPRTVNFDFSDPVSAPPCGSNCKRNFEQVTTNTSVPGGRTAVVDAQGAALPNGFRSLLPGQSARAAFLINFADPHNRQLNWTVRFNPVAGPGSTYLRVTRTGENEWVIEATNDMVASLSNYTTGTGKQVTTQEGTFRMPFRIRITTP